LGDAHAAGDGHRFTAEVYQQHLDLPAVVGIDGARRVKHGQPVSGGEAGSGPHLSFVAWR
jgi:hypothetical protein